MSETISETSVDYPPLPMCCRSCGAITWGYYTTVRHEDFEQFSCTRCGSADVFVRIEEGEA
jgi:hypothetical protein